MSESELTDKEILLVFAGLTFEEAEALVDDAIAKLDPFDPEGEAQIDQLIATLERYRSLIKLQEVMNGDHLQIIEGAT